MCAIAISKRMEMRPFFINFSIPFLVHCTVASAQVVVIPKTFSSGTPAVAAEVNANFSAISTAINKGIPGYMHTSQDFPITSNPSSVSVGTIDANIWCPAGMVATGGGYNMFTFTGTYFSKTSEPVYETQGNSVTSGWHVTVTTGPNSLGGTLTVTAICAVGLVSR